MSMDMKEAEKRLLERLMEDFYQLSLPDRMIAMLCMESVSQVERWRMQRDYPPNDPEMPLNPKTGRPFSQSELERAIDRIVRRHWPEVQA